VGESQSYEACMRGEMRVFRLLRVLLKVEEDHELNIVFMVVTRISARKHFWRYKLRS
jgi:hypothetical protein